MQKPQSTAGMAGPNEERSIVGRSRYRANVWPQHPLNQRPPAVTVSVFDQLVDLGLRQFERSGRLDQRRCRAEVVDECVRGKRQYDLRCRQLPENPGNELQFDL